MTAIHEAILGLAPEARQKLIKDIMARANEMGFRGFGGDCYQAAIAINRVLFGGAGEFVAAFNEFFLSHSRHIGHIAIRHEGVFWDADGKAKDEDGIRAWGMLDPRDQDWIEAAADLGESWTEDKADETGLFAFDDEAEVIATFGADKVTTLEEILRSAATLASIGDERPA